MYNIGIFIFDNVEVLDMAAPFEVFSVTSELNNYELCQVCTISHKTGLEVTAKNGLKVRADYHITQHPPLDMLVVPGGEGTRAIIKDKEALQWIETQSQQVKMLFSICTGSLILGKLGLLDNLTCTTHHEIFDLFREVAPQAILQSDERYIAHSQIITAAGVSAGIDASFYLVQKLFGKEIAQKSAKYIEYPYFKFD